MKFTLPHVGRTREETRTRVAHAITEMSCRISMDTLDATLRAAHEARGNTVSPTTVTQLEALATNARHLGRNVDTILWTGLPENHVKVAHAALPIAPTAHRSLSVTAIIHKFAALSEAFSHIHAPHPAGRQEDELCEDPVAS